MIPKVEFAKLKAKEARGRGVLFKEKSIREEWFTMARGWDELAHEYAELDTRQASTNGTGAA